MVVFSSLRNCLRSTSKNVSLFRSNSKNVNDVTKRLMSEHKTFAILPSKFQYKKFKDLLHFYLMVGLIPLGLLITGVNIFIGPATLSEIPEGYVPKHWEYYKHPFTRFIARYIHPSTQQEYEKYLHLVYEQHQLARLRMLERDIKSLMEARADYEAYYYIPYTNANYIRIMKEKGEEFVENFGDK